MALKNYNPTTPEPAPAGHRRPLRPLEGQAGQGADRGPVVEGRPQQYRPHHGALPGRRPQAHLSHRRLQAPQVRRRGDGRAAGIRSEPHRLHRAGELCRRRAGLHPGAAAPGAGDKVIARARRVDVKPGNAMPLESMPVGTIVHNVEMKPAQGRPDRPFGRHLCPARRPRPGHGDPAAQFGRTAPRHGACAWRPSARFPTRTIRTSTSARPAARAGSASARMSAASP